MESLAQFGVGEHRWSPYVDGELAEVLPSRGVRDLGAIIEEVD